MSPRSVLSAEKGTLRLSSRVLDDFHEHGADPVRLRAESVRELESASMLAEGALDPFVAAVAETVNDPEAVLTLSSSYPAARAFGGWVADGAMALSFPAGDDAFEVVIAPVSSFAPLVSHLIRLGPRPVSPSGGLRASVAAWRSVTHHRSSGSRVDGEVPDALALMAPSLEARWTIEVVAADSAWGRKLDVADFGDRGWWLARPAEDPDEIELVPVGAIDVWRLLTTFLG